MPDTPTNEPLKLRAGDTWAWRREDLTDYPAGTWTLKYALKNAAAQIVITAAADGTSFAVTVLAATTLGYAAGSYQWVAYVESGALRYSVDEGTLEILPAFANTSVLDDRTDARKIYDDLLAAYKTYTTNRGLVSEYTIGSRTMKFNSPEEILKQLNYWKSKVAAEETAERLRNGLGTGNKLYVRLG